MDATLKSVLGNPLTGAVYAASLAIGVITLLAFYESPISPLPVPSLPKPPVGRFPPEHPIWPPISKQAVKMPSGPQYQQAGSQQNFGFAYPPQFEKSAQLGHLNYGQGIAQGLGQLGQFGFQGHQGIQAAGSNMYPSVVAAPPRRASTGHQLPTNVIGNNQKPNTIQRKSSSEPNNNNGGSVLFPGSEEKAAVADDQKASEATSELLPSLL